MTSVKPVRIRQLNQAGVNPAGRYVLYWMLSARRSRWNFALQQALDLACELGTGLVVFEPLSCDYAFASDRFHRFVLEGMRDQQQAFAASEILYYPWVEAFPGQENELLQGLTEEAAAVVSDDCPSNPTARKQQAAAEKLPVALQLVDGNGLLPLQLVERDYPTAYAFRRLLHRALPAFIDDWPRADPLKGSSLAPARLPPNLQRHWPAADLNALLGDAGLKSLPIDHQVAPATQVGGSEAGALRIEEFVQQDLETYDRLRNIPDLDRTSRLSAYLHHGHVSAHQVFARLAEREKWHSGRLSLKPSGKRNGWWGLSVAAEAFVDELVTWRELGYSFCRHRPDYADYGGLPDWARATLEQHAGDERPYLYSYEQFRAAASHDPLWNAAQRQLLQEGRIHGYLRMLWGKKILEWSPSPRAALEIMLDLNDRYALDGGDPNSYSGISWCLGRFDRAWGPERPIFGKIRYMTSQNTARKVAVKQYLARYGHRAQGELDL